MGMCYTNFELEKFKIRIWKIFYQYILIKINRMMVVHGHRNFELEIQNSGIWGFFINIF